MKNNLGFLKENITSYDGKIKEEILQLLKKHGIIRQQGSDEIFIKTSNGGILQFRISHIRNI